MTPKQDEILLILQEECAEVIQVISKINRFGMRSSHPARPEEGDNRQRLIEEVGDVLCMIELLVHNSDITVKELLDAGIRKQMKLRKWSKIFDENS